MTDPTTPPDPGERPLWTSDHQRIACREHLPAPGTDAWWANRWHVMSIDEQEGFAGAAGYWPACEACAALADLHPAGEGAERADDDPQRARAIAEIARSMGIETLEAAGRDRLDFHDLHVTAIRDALLAAYRAGQAAAKGGAR